MGTFYSVKRHVVYTFETTQSQLMKKQVSKFMRSSDCPICREKRLTKEPLSVKFSGMDIADMTKVPLEKLYDIFQPYIDDVPSLYKRSVHHPEKVIVIKRIAEDLCARLSVLLDL
ncbi:MAG: hypothetical protein ACOH2A_08685 [Sphingobacteriaceae bacterium]